MKLSRKTFLYSLLLAVLIVGFIAGYFVLMLPSLYVDFVMQSDYNGIVDLQKGYMQTRSYDKLNIRNPGSCLTLEIPEKGNQIKLSNYFFQLDVEVKKEQLLNLLDEIRYYMKNPEEFSEWMKDEEKTKELVEELKAFLLPENLLPEDYPLKFHLDLNQNPEIYEEEKEKVHIVSKNLLVWEGSVTDGTTYYNSYVAFGTVSDAVIISVQAVMTPQMEEIKPVVLQSLPMIAAVTVLIILVASRFFSEQIVHPIVRLAAHVRGYQTGGWNVKSKGEQKAAISRNEKKNENEIVQLSQAFEELYTKLWESYQDLEEKNQFLAEENKRQEIFLRASSHQLKTPIAAALLLLDGMIGEVGKYRDTKAYLPQVKEQLKSMQKLVQDILYLNHCTKHLEFSEFSLESLLEECLLAYRFQILDKLLCVERITLEGEPFLVWSDRELLKKMLDNLFSNAVQHTPKENKIEIVQMADSVQIRNYGIMIEENLLSSIFEPFVTSNHKEKGHGLGLYVTAYYARVLGIQIEIKNLSDWIPETDSKRQEIWSREDGRFVRKTKEEVQGGKNLDTNQGVEVTLWIPKKKK